MAADPAVSRHAWHVPANNAAGTGTDTDTCDSELLAQAFASYGLSEGSGATDVVGPLLPNAAWTAAAGRIASCLVAARKNRRDDSDCVDIEAVSGEEEICPFCLEPALEVEGALLPNRCAHPMCGRSGCVEGRRGWLESAAKCPLCCASFTDVLLWESVRRSPAFQALAHRQLSATLGMFDDCTYDIPAAACHPGPRWNAVKTPVYPAHVQRELLLARDNKLFALAPLVVANSPCYYICNMQEGFQVKVRLDFSKQRTITLGRGQASVRGDESKFVALDDNRNAHEYRDEVQKIIRLGLQCGLNVVFDLASDSILCQPFEIANVAGRECGLASAPVHGHVLHLGFMRQVPFHLDVTPEGLLRVRKLECTTSE